MFVQSLDWTTKKCGVCQDLKHANIAKYNISESKSEHINIRSVPGLNDENMRCLSGFVVLQRTAALERSCSTGWATI